MSRICLTLAVSLFLAGCASTGRTHINQDRNQHDLMDDFRSEVPMYLQTEEALARARSAVNPLGSLRDNLIEVYRSLEDGGIVGAPELPLLFAWLNEVCP